LKATLVSSSEPSAELVSQGIDNVQELVAYCARVSNPANQTNTNTSERLIRYLIRHKQSEETKQRIRENQPKKTEEWKQSHDAAMSKRRGIPFTQKYKSVIVDNIEYPSVKHAIESLNIKHRATFYNRVKRGIIKLEYK
jgi:DNA gyrase inhibitor GyrI